MLRESCHPLLKVPSCFGHCVSDASQSERRGSLSYHSDIAFKRLSYPSGSHCDGSKPFSPTPLFRSLLRVLQRIPPASFLLRSGHSNPLSLCVSPRRRHPSFLQRPSLVQSPASDDPPQRRSLRGYADAAQQPRVQGGGDVLPLLLLPPISLLRLRPRLRCLQPLLLPALCASSGRLS